MVDTAVDRLMGDALFGHDGTQSPGPLPVFADPLAGFAPGLVLAGIGDEAAAGQNRESATSLTVGLAPGPPQQDVRALRHATHAALARPLVGTSAARGAVQPLSRPHAFQSAAAQSRAASSVRGLSGYPSQRRRGRSASWIVAVLVVAVFAALQVFGGEFSALVARLFHH